MPGGNVDLQYNPFLLKLELGDAYPLVKVVAAVTNWLIPKEVIISSTVEIGEMREASSVI